MIWMRLGMEVNEEEKNDFGLRLGQLVKMIKEEKPFRGWSDQELNFL